MLAYCEIKHSAAETPAHPLRIQKNMPHKLKISPPGPTTLHLFASIICVSAPHTSLHPPEQSTLLTFLPAHNLVASAAGDAEDGLELLEDDELQTGGGREPGPNRDEARVQALGPVLRHDL